MRGVCAQAQGGAGAGLLGAPVLAGLKINSVSFTFKWNRN